MWCARQEAVRRGSAAVEVLTSPAQLWYPRNQHRRQHSRQSPPSHYNHTPPAQAPHPLIHHHRCRTLDLPGMVFHHPHRSTTSLFWLDQPITPTIPGWTVALTTLHCLPSRPAHRPARSSDPRAASRLSWTSLQWTTTGIKHLHGLYYFCSFTNTYISSYRKTYPWSFSGFYRNNIAFVLC